MARIAVSLALSAVFAVCACQRGNDTDETPAAEGAATSDEGETGAATSDEGETGAGEPGGSAWARDIERICHAEERSGALDRPEGERWIAVARWLGPNIETRKARELLATLTRAPPADKAAMLDDAARKAGVSACPTARTWAPE